MNDSDICDFWRPTIKKGLEQFETGMVLMVMKDPVKAAYISGAATRPQVTSALKEEFGLQSLKFVSPFDSETVATMFGRSLPDGADSWQQVIVVLASTEI